MRSLIAMVCWGDPHVNSDSHNQFLACFRDWQSRLCIDFSCQKLVLIRLLATSYWRLVWNHFCPSELILSCFDLILTDQTEFGFDSGCPEPILILFPDCPSWFWADSGCHKPFGNRFWPLEIDWEWILVPWAWFCLTRTRFWHWLRRPGTDS